jgi:small subunit ribosomal protein S17e
MGRIKTVLIKRNTRELFDRYKKDFSVDFEKNKKIVEQKAEIKSKKLRNVIAGYVARLVKQNHD